MREQEHKFKSLAHRYAYKKLIFKVILKHISKLVSESEVRRHRNYF